MILNITIDDITSDLLQEFINKDIANKEIMREADKYYNVENTTISNRKKMMMLFDDKERPYLKEDLSKANNRIRHSYLQELINQCTNYLVGKPIKIDYKKAFDKVIKDINKDGIIDENEKSITGGTQAEVNKEIIDNNLYKYNDFVSFLQTNVTNVQLYGVSYLRLVVDTNIKFITYNPSEIIMFYNDFDEPILAIRYFEKTEIINKEIKPVGYVEVFDKQYKDTWKKDKKGWIKSEREYVYSHKLKFGNKDTKVELFDVGLFPIIEWRFNSNKIPTLVNIKDFIDLQDTNLSDLANNVEDIQEAIWILENYTGQNIREFMEDLKLKKAVKVGMGGNARTETIQIPIEARDRLYELCRKNIYKFGFGIDFQERDSLGNVSGVALKWSYAPLEQKANAIETNGQSALNKFFNILFKLLGFDYDSNDIEFIFDKTMIANEQEQTATIMSASSELSQKTILDNLPMVMDTEDELERLNDEDEYRSISTEDIEIRKADEESINIGNENSVFDTLE